jgi:hypothetical protein
MATQINLKASLTYSVDSAKGGIDGSTPNPLNYDFTAPAKYVDTRQTLSAAYADIDFGDVGWTNATLVCFKNHSSTSGEDIYLLIVPTITAGGTDAGTVSGASVPATQTGAGYYQRITTAGTSQGKTWAIGDYAFYLGASGTYLQITPKKIVLKPGESCAFRVGADGNAWKVASATGTPQLGKTIIGACA